MNVFRRRSREVLVENAWHRYCVDAYTLRDGSTGAYYYVDMPGSAAIVPLFADGSTMLVEVERYLLGRKIWEFPIGGMREGEDALVVARRELREEAGLVASRWDPLGAFAPYKGVSNELCHCFLARDLEIVEQELEASELIRPERFDLTEARRVLLGQELPDGQSLSALMLFDRFNSGA